MSEFKKTIKLLHELDQMVDDSAKDFKFAIPYEVGDYQYEDGVKWIVVKSEPKMKDGLCMRMETVWEKVND